MENAACHFVFYTGPRKGEAQAFNTARISVGRASSCDFRLEAFQLDQVGTHHAEVLLEEGNVYCLYDLGTKSGTYVNGERVHERCTLMHEDYVRFGQDGPEVLFRTGEPMPGKQPLPQVFPVTAELEFFSGSDAGRIFPVNAVGISNIGRRADLEIPLDPRGDMIVSGNHCNIRYINGHFVLSDSSRNGTYVNGDLVDQPMEILEGDVIMMGDGGPQARFHVDQAKRHYPNHRALSPVVKKDKEKEHAESAFSRAPKGAGISATGAAAAGAAASSPMASAAPYSSGGTPLPGAIKSETQVPPADQPPAEAHPAPDAVEVSPATVPESVPPAALGHGSEFDAETVEVGPDTLDVTDDSATSTETVPPANPAGRKFALPAAVPALHKLKFKPGKKVIFGAIALVLVIALIAMFSSGDDETGGVAGRGDYDKALESLVSLTNAPGGFKVQVPEGWTNLSRDNFISTESRDKHIAVDYVRDPALNEEQVREMLAQNGAQVAAEAEERTVDGVQLKTLTASAGNVRRIATLHLSGSGAPALALMETTKNTMEKLDEDSIEKLLVENLVVVGPGPVAAVTPGAPAAPVRQSLPTPSAATPSPQVAATQPSTTTPAPTVTPEATVAPTAPAGLRVESKALKLTIVPPEGWTGISEEADAMLTLSDGAGMEIRIARDPGELDAKLTFDAMKEEDWVEDGRKTDKATYKAGEFSKEDQNLMLVLIPEKAKTTIVVYATSEKDFTEKQRYGINDIIWQLIPR